SDTFRISMSVQPQERPSASIWDDLTLVTFMSNGLQAVRLDAQGNPIDTSPLLIDGSKAIHDYAVGFTGNAWIVAWSDYQPGTSRPRLKLRRILRDGSMAEDSPIDLGSGYNPVFFCTNGSKSLLLFIGRKGEEILPLDADGLPLPAQSRPLNTLNDVSIGTNGHEFLVALVDGSADWDYPAPNLRDVNFMRLNADGAPMDASPIPVANSRMDETFPRVTSDGRDFFVFFMRSGGPFVSSSDEICARKVTREGFLDGVVAGDESASSLIKDRPLQQQFAVARDAGHFVLVWQQFSLTVPYSNDQYLAATDGSSLLEPPQALADGVQPAFAIAEGSGRKVLTYSRLVPELGDVPRVFTRTIGVPLTKRHVTRP
ncbi:MAG: hypothetical protein ABI837_15890, partial [Acidobacteriota bacterium]